MPTEWDENTMIEGSLCSMPSIRDVYFIIGPTRRRTFPHRLLSRLDDIFGNLLQNQPFINIQFPLPVRQGGEYFISVIKQGTGQRLCRTRPNEH